MAELKPCPFCGGEAKAKHGYPNRQCKSPRQAFVQCKACKCKTVTYTQLPYQAWSDVDRLATEAWNKRTERPKGRWKRVYDDSAGWVDMCTNCEEYGDEKDNFCHNCGADMRGESDGT